MVTTPTKETALYEAWTKGTALYEAWMEKLPAWVRDRMMASFARRRPVLDAHWARDSYVVTNTLVGTLDEGMVVTSIRIERWGVTQFWVRRRDEKLKALVAEDAGATSSRGSIRVALQTARMRTYREGPDLARVLERPCGSQGTEQITTIGQNMGRLVQLVGRRVRGESRLIGYDRWRL
jgi:hypothetical protein